MKRLSVLVVTLVVGLLGVTTLGENLAAAALQGALQRFGDRGIADFEYRQVENWAQLPAGEVFGGISGVDVDSKGQVHVHRRDFHAAGTTIWTLDANGKFLRAWGDAAVNTHGLDVDREDNIWTTDSLGHQVKKYSPEGKLLLTLGKLRVRGQTQDTFDQPTAVTIAQNGDIFVADGYGNSRIVHFTKDGKYVKEWGTLGSGAGQLDMPHGIVQDSRGRLLVADRDNVRVQLFDIEGKYLGQWSHFGAPFGLAINSNDTLVVADFGGTTSPSDSEGHVAIADARTGRELYRIEGITHSHSVAIDATGNTIYVASNSSGHGNTRGVKKYVKVPKTSKTTS